jgi:hypothetical protein
MKLNQKKKTVLEEQPEEQPEEQGEVQLSQTEFETTPGW